MGYEYQEYPKMLFLGDDYLIVDDADQEDAALKDGWFTSPNPLDHDADGKSGGQRRGRPKRQAE